MIFNKHFNLAGTHAFLSASQNAWTNYDEEKLDMMFSQSMAARRGTELHALAHDLIRLGIKLPKTSATLNQYVNDAIGYRMKSEQVFFYSENCYGTADAASFRKERGYSRPVFRCHDLKTGLIPASERQLEVYAAMFCLEYHQNPFEIDIVLRIYQSDTFKEFHPDPDQIVRIMEQIKIFNKRITAMKLEAEIQ